MERRNNAVTPMKINVPKMEDLEDNAKLDDNDRDGKETFGLRRDKLIFSEEKLPRTDFSKFSNHL